MQNNNKSKHFLNTVIGNWKYLPIDTLRLCPDITCNKGFFSSFTYILQCLPYIEKNYEEKVNIKYYSHNYGNYPNFEVFGKLIKFNYSPTLTNKKSKELLCLDVLSKKKICGKQFNDEKPEEFYSFKNNFKLAKQYFDKYFIFDKSITNKVNDFTKDFKNVLGIHFRGTDKNKVKWITHCSSNEFIKIIKNHLENNTYEKIFVASDDMIFIKELKKTVNIPVLHYDEINSSTPIHLDRLEVISNIVNKIKKADFNSKKILENELKKECDINQKLLEDAIINCLILSRCKTVIKTHSQLSAYAKVFNPDLEIYRVNGSPTCYWPDAYIPLYPQNNNIKSILEKIQLNECNFKHKYKEFSELILK